MKLKKNTEPYISTYLHNKGRRLGLPIAGNFELTARCNFDCPMCYVHLHQEDIDAQGKELTAQQWIEIARQAKDRGMMFALLTGGEPFVRKDFFEIYSALRRMGILVSINSNGSMLSGEIRERLLEDPPARMNISLYGGCSKTYRDMCGQDAFDRVVDNIRALRQGGVDVCINLSITPYNYQDLDKIYRIANELGVYVRATSYMYPSIRVNGEQYGCGNRFDPEKAAACGVHWDTLRFSEEQFAARALKMRELKAVEETECPIEAEEGVRCRAGHSAFWMTWDGRMLPCGMMPGPAFRPLEVGFEEAWQQLRQATAAIRTPSRCVECPKRELCPSCAASCIAETGDFGQVPEYMCRWVDATIEETWNVYQKRRGQNAD